MNQDSCGLDRRPASAKVYRSRMDKTKARCQSLRSMARKFHVKNWARCRRKTQRRSKSTRHDPNREYVLFQSARFNVRVMKSARALPCSVKISEEAINGLAPAALIVRVWPLNTNARFASFSRRGLAEHTTGHTQKDKTESKKGICLHIKLRDLRMICQHSSSLSAVLARCTLVPGLFLAANKRPVRLLDFILKPGRDYPHAMGRQMSFQLGQCVMQALSLSMHPAMKLVLTDKVFSVVRVQANLRRWAAKKVFKKRKQAVKKVQRMWRMRAARSMLNLYKTKQHRRELEHRSSVQVQRFWRKRVRLRNRKKAAIKLQRSWRVTTIRRANSAVQIQCLWRRFKSVKILMLLKKKQTKRVKMALWLQSHYRRLATQKEIQRIRASSTLQSFWRKYVAFNRMLEVKRQFAELNYNYRYVISGAITKLQRRWRARKCLDSSLNAPFSQTLEMLKNRYYMHTASRRMARAMSDYMTAGLDNLHADADEVVLAPMATEPSTDPQVCHFA